MSLAFPGAASFYADVILDFEVGKLNGGGVGAEYDPEWGALPRIARIEPYKWRTQILAGDGERLINDIVGKYTLGATLFKTKGFYRGTGAPGYVVRLLGSDVDRDLPDAAELEAIAKALATRLKLVLHQWDVWVLFTDANGAKTLMRAGRLTEDEVAQAEEAAQAAYRRLEEAS